MVKAIQEVHPLMSRSGTLNQLMTCRDVLQAKLQQSQTDAENLLTAIIYGRISEPPEALHGERN